MFRFLLTVFLATTLLTACGDSARDKAAIQALSSARAQEEQLSPEQTIALYQSVIDKYSKTKQAEQARAAILLVKRHQQSALFKRSASLVFKRVRTVLDGYQAFSGKLPLRLQDLDSNGYMFDSAYLAEILPEDVALYLELAADKGATRMWLLKTGQEQILSRNLATPQLKALTVDDLQALQAKWQEIARVGRLTQIKL